MLARMMKETLYQNLNYAILAVDEKIFYSRDTCHHNILYYNILNNNKSIISAKIKKNNFTKIERGQKNAKNMVRFISVIILEYYYKI